MEQNVTATEQTVAEAPIAAPAGSFATKIGRTTYMIGVFFDEKSKASYDDKAKKMIMNDMKLGSF